MINFTAPKYLDVFQDKYDFRLIDFLWPHCDCWPTTKNCDRSKGNMTWLVAHSYLYAMADVHTKEQRSYNMSRIKGRNTKPEMMENNLYYHFINAVMSGIYSINHFGNSIAGTEY